MRRFNQTSKKRMVSNTLKGVYLTLAIALLAGPAFAITDTALQQRENSGGPQSGDQAGEQPPGKTQPGEERGRGKGRGGHRVRQRHDDAFFLALREVHKRFGSTRELIMMVRNREIQAEIQLKPEGFKQLEDHANQIFDLMTDLRRQMGEEEVVDFEEVGKRVMEVAEKHNDELYGILTKVVGDVDRMLGIYVQAAGPRAAVNELVAKKIGISESERKQLLKDRDELWQRTMKDRFKQIGQLIRTKNREEMQVLIAKSERDFKDQLSDLLTKDQRKKLGSLKGEPFDLPENVFGMPRRGGGRGDKNPPRPDGQRPPKPCV